MTLKNNRAPLLCTIKFWVSQPLVNSKWSCSPETFNSGQNRGFFCPARPWNFTDELEKNTAPILCYSKLCASFHSHLWIQTGVTVRKRPIWVKIGNFSSPVTLKFDGWPWKIVGHIFYATSSFVHLFIAVGEFKLELQSGNARIWAKFVLISVTLTFDLWRPLPFAWTPLLSMVITSENFMMTKWQKHCEKGVTDGRTDRQKDTKVLRGAWSQLKTYLIYFIL